MYFKYLHHNKASKTRNYDAIVNYHDQIMLTTSDNTLNYYEKQIVNRYHQPFVNENHLKRYDRAKYQQHHNCYQNFPNCNHYLNELMNLCTKPHHNYWKNFIIIIALFTLFDFAINLIFYFTKFAVNAAAIASPDFYSNDNHLGYLDHFVNTENGNSFSPYFLKVPDTIETTVGQTAILSCKVENLGDRMVFWIRSSDLSILTAGPHTFSSDQRLSSEFPNGDYTDWGLIIENVNVDDTGQYECQVNTEPKIKTYVKLIVREQQLMDSPSPGTNIVEGRNVVTKSGSTVTFTCNLNVDENNEYQLKKFDQLKLEKGIQWKKNNEFIANIPKMSGFYVEIQWNLYSVTSKLTLSSVQTGDNGTYTCTTTDPDYTSDFIELHVIDGQKSEAMHNSKVHNNFMLNISILIFIIAIHIFLI